MLYTVNLQNSEVYMDHCLYHLIFGHGHTVFIGWKPSVENMTKDKVKFLFNKETHTPRVLAIKCEEGSDLLAEAQKDLNQLHVIYDMRNMEDRVGVWCQKHMLGNVFRHNAKTVSGKDDLGFYILETTPELNLVQRPGSDEVSDVFVVNWDGSPMVDNGVFEKK